MSEKMTTGFA